jgi:acyl-CoA reductase-like NAD-dependent aldehyde dehydrogenase
LVLLAGFTVPDEIKLLMVPLTTTGPEEWLSHEKLSPVLGWFIVENKEAAISAAVTQLEFGGSGHSVAIFTEEEAVMTEYALRVPANRVVWNKPSVQGTIGSLYNCLVPSLTLGCGARGSNTALFKPEQVSLEFSPASLRDVGSDIRVMVFARSNDLRTLTCCI